MLSMFNIFKSENQRVMDHARLLNDSSVGTREKAAHFLSALIVNRKWTVEHNRMLTATPGSIENLVRLLQEPSAELRKNAALILKGLADIDENQLKIVAIPGSVESLVRLLQDSSEGVVKQAAFTLQSLTFNSYERYNVRTQMEIVAIPGLLESVVRLLQHPWPNVKFYAATVLKNLAACHPENQVKIAAVPGSLESLVRLLQGPVETSIHIALLRDLAGHPGNKVKIAAIPGLLESLARLLQGPGRWIPGEAARALGSIAEHPENQVKIATIPGLLESLARLSQFRDIYSICALANLACHPENQVKIAAIPGLLESLVQSSKEVTLYSRLKNEAARALANLACNAIIKMDIEGIKAGVERLSMLRGAADARLADAKADAPRLSGEMAAYWGAAAHVSSYVEPEVSNPKADRAWLLGELAAERDAAEARKQPKRDLEKAEYDFAHTFYSSGAEADMARAQLDLARLKYSQSM